MAPALATAVRGARWSSWSTTRICSTTPTAALLLQLATARVVRLLLTLRSGTRVPDALLALWKDRFVNRIELQPLGSGDTADLLGGVLGGHVDGSTVDRAWRVTGGNALYVRELVDDLLRTGALHESGGVWRWDGDLAPGARLVELVQTRLDRLGDDERLGVDLLAVAERLEASVLLDLCGRSAVGRLEDEAFVTITQEGRRAWAQLVHPVYGDVLRPTLGRMRWADLCARLFATVRATGARRAGDVLRLVVWARESGIDVEPRLLIDAAVHANTLTDRELAERLGREALTHLSSATAALAVGEALVSQERYHEAVEVLAGVDAGDDATRARIADWYGMAVHGVEKNADAACAVLATAEGLLSERRWIDFLRADRASILAQSGEAEAGDRARRAAPRRRVDRRDREVSRHHAGRMALGRVGSSGPRCRRRPVARRRRVGAQRRAAARRCLGVPRPCRVDDHARRPRRSRSVARPPRRYAEPRGGRPRRALPWALPPPARTAGAGGRRAACGCVGPSAGVAGTGVGRGRCSPRPTRRWATR